jgi:hypothetical protein
MSRALIINQEDASNYVVDVKPINDLYYESFISPGIVIFFDIDYNIIMFAESCMSVEELAKDIEPEEAYYYNIISNENYPMTDDQLDDMYDGILANKFSIYLLSEEEKPTFTVCLN